MNNENYNNRRNSRGGRQINFDDDDFGGNSRSDRSDYGRLDTDWADDLATRADGRLSEDYNDTRRRNVKQEESPMATRPTRRRTYEDYDEDDKGNGFISKPQSNRDNIMEPKKSFAKRHPVLMNIFYVIIAMVLISWVLMWFLDYWTFHGEERVVPDVKGQTYSSAAGNVDLSGLRAVITDSVFDSYSRPGTVVEQTPVPGARIKKGGTVYLTIVAFTPKLVTVPDFYNVSVRQARSMFQGLGIKDIREESVISVFAGLVLGAKFNGVALHPGIRIPVSAIITLEVGTGYTLDDDFGADVDSVAIDKVIDELTTDIDG